MAFRWTAKSEARLARDYLGGETSAQIAARLGVDRLVVSRKVSALGLNAKLSSEARLARKRATVAAVQAKGLAVRQTRGQFIWTAERLAELHRRYVVDQARAGVIACAMGCDQKAVSRKVCDLGLAALRPVHLRQVDRLRGAQSGRAVQAAARAAPAPTLTDSELIAAAVAAGRVTHLPPGHACGTTRWEAMLQTARPPRPSAEAVAAQRRIGMAAHAARAALALAAPT